MREIVRFDRFCLETSYDNVGNEIWRLNFKKTEKSKSGWVY